MGTEILFAISHVDVGLLLIFRQPLDRQLRKNGGDTFMILCILPCDFCKLFVDPEKFSLRIHDGIGQRQFLDQMLLNLAVFGRKGNQLIDHLRTLSVIENCGCDHIDCKKQREPHSCHHIHKIHADIHHKHQDGQNQRPSKIAPQLAAQLHFAFHFLTPFQRCVLYFAPVLPIIPL